MYGAVEIRFEDVLAYMLVGEEKMATYTASSLRLGEIGSVTANVEYHSTSGIPDCSVRM